MTKGFYIKKLLLRGTAKPDATMVFTPGLNVIAGASNTGKTYIYQCIDFMLGGKKPPKEIKESTGYQYIFLELTTYTNQSYTLRRSITGGPFFIKDGEVDGDGTMEEYLEKLSDNEKNISTFLLSLCELKNIKLRQNALNKKVRLSFRDVAHFCMVDEKQIITEDSPVYSEDIVNRTKEQSLFGYFILGTDASTLEENEDPKLFKSRISGKIELIKELQQRVQNKLDTYKDFDASNQESALSDEYERLNLEYKKSIAEIDKLRNERNAYIRNVENIDTKTLFKKELTERFELLQEHYKNDLSRLDFISEGNFLFRQINNIACPICGAEITDGHADHLNQFHKDTDNLQDSISTEMGKITLKISELSDTLAELSKDISKQEKSVVKLKVKISEIDTNLNLSLAPVSKSLKVRLQELFDKKSEIDRFNSLRAEMASYANQLNTLQEQLKNKPDQRNAAIAFQEEKINAFCHQVEWALTQWNFPNITSLTFNNASTEFDIRINNNSRASNGKGYRAITYTAFLFGLLQYCLKEDRNYPYFLILDSPLTTFKERDSASPEDSIGEGVERAFYQNLASQTGQYQIIILENKEPDQDLTSNMNYVHFSGESGEGRQGFFKTSDN